jgi:hypothetical protein
MKEAASVGDLFYPIHWQQRGPARCTARLAGALSDVQHADALTAGADDPAARPVPIAPGARANGFIEARVRSVSI